MLRKKSGDVYDACKTYATTHPATITIFRGVEATALATASYAASLAIWYALFFISGKEVWYLPQYDMDLNPNYF